MPTENKIKAIIALYSSHQETELAIWQLENANFDMRNLSIIGRDHQSDEHVIGYYNSGDRMRYLGKVSAFWDGIWGKLFGSAFLVVPGVGPVIVAGPVVSWIIGALESVVAGGSLGVIGAGLDSVGIPRDSIFEYKAAIRANNFMVIAHGSEMEIDQARAVLMTGSADLIDEHELKIDPSIVNRAVSNPILLPATCSTATA